LARNDHKRAREGAEKGQCRKIGFVPTRLVNGIRNNAVREIEE